MKKVIKSLFGLILLCMVFVFVSCEIQTSKQYEVKFMDGEAVLTSEKLTAGSAIVAPELPSKPGYRAAWNETIAEVVGENDLVYTVVYTLLNYNAKFIVDDTEIATQQFNVETTKLEEPTVPTKQGYTGRWENYTIGPNNLVINAVYTINQYKVIFKDHSGVVSEQTLDYGTEIVVPQQTPVNYTDESDGKTYVFLNWGTVDTTVPDHDVEFNAVYRNLEQVTVTFKDANGEVLNTELVEKGQIVSAPTNNPTKEGYNFKEWQLNGTAFNFRNAINENIELVPAFDAIEYDYVFKADGVTVDTLQFTVETTELTLPTIPSKNGYNGSWPTLEFTVGSKEVNAVYTAIEYDMVFKADGNTIETLKFTVETKELVLPSVPSKDGYEGSWPTLEFTVGNKEVNVIYTAITYNITYNLNEGSNNETNPAIYNVETSITLEPATKDGWKFDGWYKESSFITKVESIVLGTIGDLTLNAKFVPNIENADPKNITYTDTEYALYFANHCVNTNLTVSTDVKYNGEQVLKLEVPFGYWGFIYFDNLINTNMNAKDEYGNYLFNYLTFYVKSNYKVRYKINDIFAVDPIPYDTSTDADYQEWHRITLTRQGTNFIVTDNWGNISTVFSDPSNISVFEDSSTTNLHNFKLGVLTSLEGARQEEYIYVTSIKGSKYLPEVEAQMDEEDNVTYFNKTIGLDMVSDHPDTLVYTDTNKHLDGETNSLKWNVTWAGWRTLVFDNLAITNLNEKDDNGNYLYDYVYFYVYSDVIDGLNVNGCVWKVPFMTGKWSRVVLTRTGDTFTATDSFGTAVNVFSDTGASVTNLNGFKILVLTETNNVDIYFSAFRACKNLPTVIEEPVTYPIELDLTLSDTANAMSYIIKDPNTTVKVAEDVTLDGEQVLEWGIPWAGFGWITFTNLPLSNLNAKDSDGNYLYDYVYFYVKSETLGTIGTTNTWTTYFTSDGTWQRIVLTRSGDNFIMTTHDGHQSVFNETIKIDDVNGLQLRTYAEANGNVIYLSTLRAVKTLPSA